MGESRSARVTVATFDGGDAALVVEPQVDFPGAFFVGFEHRGTRRGVSLGSLREIRRLFERAARAIDGTGEAAREDARVEPAAVERDPASAGAVSAPSPLCRHAMKIRVYRRETRGEVGAAGRNKEHRGTRPVFDAECAVYICPRDAGGCGQVVTRRRRRTGGGREDVSRVLPD